MALGTSIFLIAAGAILAFALDGDIFSALDVNIVGYILMAVGVLGVVLSLVINNQRRSTLHRTIVDDRRYPQDPPPPPGY